MKSKSLFENCPNILPNGTPTKIVVFLHGYGSNGEDLLEIGQNWKSSLPTTAFFAPNAFDRCEANSFDDSYQWFGLQDFNPLNIRAGLDKARPLLTRNIKRLLSDYRLSPSDLIIVGFSQGTMMALDMLFSLARLGGIIGYSGAFYPPANSQPLSTSPILLVHGSADMVVPYAAMQLAQTQLRQLGLNVMTHTCPDIGHSIDEAGLMMGLDFIKYQQENQPIAL